MKHFRQDANVSALMVELNRRLYMDEATGARVGDHTSLRTALAEVLSGIAAELANRGSS
jgi:N-formylglutamate amidohydrolase